MCDGDDATGAGGGSPEFTYGGFYAGNITAATGTTVHLTNPTLSLAASSTFATRASSTQMTNTGSTWLTTITSALISFDANGIASEYAGLTCTNQFVRALSALGVATCETVGTADVAGLDISDDTNLAATYPITLTGDTLSFPATSTLYGTGTGGNVLAWINSTPAWLSTTTIPLGGDVTGALSATVVGDDSHAHTGSTLSGIDISADTNLTAGTNITLTGDDLSVDYAFLLNTGDAGTGNFTFSSGLVTHANATSTLLTSTTAWIETLNLTNDLTVANGGTGASTLTGLLQGNGTSAITGITNSSTVGQILRVTGASTYAWGALDLDDTDAFTGTLPIANTQLTAGDNLTLTTDDLDLDAVLTGLTSITVTNASTTNFTASTYASTSKFYADGLGCATGSYTTWTAGVFGCATDAQGTGAWPFTITDTNFGVTVLQSTTTPLWFKGNGTWGMFASSTSVFDQATTTRLTVSDVFYHAGSAFTSFVSDATLDLVAGVLRVVDLICTDCINATEIEDIFLLNSGDVGTGAYDFGGASDFEIPNASNPTVNVAGEIAINTTAASSSLRFYDGTAERALFDETDVAFYQATTTSVAGTTTLKLAGPIRQTTYTQIGCNSTGGTFNIQLGDGTASSTMITSTDSATLTTFTTLSSNNTFNKGEARYIAYGTPSATTIKDISCTLGRRYDAD